MKRIAIVLFVALFLALFCSCQTGHLDYPIGEGQEYIPLIGSYSDDDIAVAVESQQLIADSSYLEVLIQNKSNEIEMINANTLMYGNRIQSVRLVTGETRKINANLSQADIPVAPNGLVVKSLYPGNDGEYIFSTMEGSLYLSYTRGQNSKTIAVDLKPKTAKVDPVCIGKVSVSGRDWHILFAGDTRSRLCEELLEEARKQYGSDVSIQNIEYSVTWNILSMLFYFDMFGYVQDYEATADVVR